MAFRLFRITLLMAVLSPMQTAARPPIQTPTVSVPFSITPAPHPPIPTANVLPLPPEFSDIPKHVIECWDSQANYSVTSSFLALELERSKSWSTSTFPTPSVNKYLVSYSYDDCSGTTYPGLTTLCDGYPRASACEPACATRTSIYWESVTYSYFLSSVYPSWKTEFDQLTSPTCTVATDFGPECSRLNEAFEWRQTKNAPDGTVTTESLPIYLEAPKCSVLLTPVSQKNAKPICSMSIDSYEAYYWPTPPPSGSEFCNPNTTRATATPTISEKGKTAIVSGLTLTSPSVYYLLRNITVETYIGKGSGIGSGYTSPVYVLSTTINDEERLLTLAQREGEILSQSKTCSGRRGAVHCTVSYEPNFLINDLKTVQASHYHPGWPFSASETICQDQYTPNIVLPLTDVARQNKIFEDCSWTQNIRALTTLIGPNVMTLRWYGGQSYYPITEGIGAVGGASTVVARPGSTTVGPSAPTAVA